MLRLLCLGTMTVGALAQTPSVQDLLSLQWRIRNDTARALAAEEQLPVAKLLDVLRTDWEGHVPTSGRFGGRGGEFEPKDPRLKVLYDTRKQLTTNARSYLPNVYGPRDAQDLIAPWAPEELALWLLLQRPRSAEPIDLSPTALPLARAWLHLLEHDDEALLAVCADEAHAQFIVHALWLQGPEGQARLRSLDLRKLPHARRAVLRIRDRAFREDALHLPYMVEQALHDTSINDRNCPGTALPF